jgi:peptide/nickel transport system substrate-binding protein
VAQPSVTTSTPKDGGQLRIAAAGRGAAETYDPNKWASYAELERASLVYEPLVSIDPDGNVMPMLAESMSPNADASVWTVKLRPGVTFQDGTPLEPSDVLDTFERLADPEGLYAKQNLASVDFSKSKVVDGSTFEIALASPNATFDRSVYGDLIVPAGLTEFAKPNGTGPFAFESGTAGSEANYVRNAGYWGTAPHLDKVTVLSIDDAQARVAALTSGQVDVIDDVPFVQASALKPDETVQLVEVLGNSSAPFYMDMTTAPFDDPKVRLAMRLAIDRDKCVQNALFGFGKVGNDILTPGDYAYNADLTQRAYDPEAAKKLLSDAGYPSGLTVTLTTASTFTGMSECATIFADSAKAAGITINLNKVPDADLFNPAAGFPAEFGSTWWPVGIEDWIGATLLPDSPYNETRMDDATFAEGFAAAEATVDTAQRVVALKALQEQLWEDSGYIIWGEQPFINAAASNVRGYSPYSSSTAGPVDVRGVWLE